MARDSRATCTSPTPATIASVRSRPDGSIFTVAGNGLAAFAATAGRLSPRHAEFPVGVAVDSAGKLYIADTGNHRIRRVDAAGNITTVAGTGTPGHSPDGTLARARPTRHAHLDRGRSGRCVYLSETGSNVVRRIVPGGVSEPSRATACGDTPATAGGVELEPGHAPGARNRLGR